MQQTPRGVLGKYPRRGVDDDKLYETRCIRLNNNALTSLTSLSELLSALLVQPDALGWLDVSFNSLPNIDPVRASLQTLITSRHYHRLTYMY